MKPCCRLTTFFVYLLPACLFIFLYQQATDRLEQDVENVTEQVKRMGQAELEHRLASTSTTVITTKTETEGSAVAGGVVDKTVAHAGRVEDKTSVTHTTEPRSNKRI